VVSYLQLIRPVNVAIGAVSIFLGAFITGTVQPLMKVLLACASGGLITGGANAINDYFDVEIDRINKPHRPLASGRIRPRDAIRFAIVLFAVGLLLSLAINPAALAIATFATGMVALYSAKLKGTVLWGNVTVSAVSALAFLYGGVAVGRVGAAWIPAGFALLFHFGREIIKDVEDGEGDRRGHALTLPVKYGERAALSVATAVFVALIGATLLPYLVRIYDSLYLAVVLLGVDTVLLFVIVSMWRNPAPRNLGRLSNLLKADMVVGLVAIYLGQ